MPTISLFKHDSISAMCEYYLLSVNRVKIWVVTSEITLILQTLWHDLSISSCNLVKSLIRLHYTQHMVAQMVKHLPAMRETKVWSLGREDPLEKEMATHSSTLAWKIPWTEEPSSLQSMVSQRVGHDWATSLSLYPRYLRRKLHLS